MVILANAIIKENKTSGINLEMKRANYVYRLTICLEHSRKYSHFLKSFWALFYLLWNTSRDRLGKRIKSAFTSPAYNHFCFKLQPQLTSLAVSFTLHTDAHPGIVLVLLFPALPNTGHIGPLSSLKTLVCLSCSNVFTECSLFLDCLLNLPLPPP